MAAKNAHDAHFLGELFNLAVHCFASQSLCDQWHAWGLRLGVTLNPKPDVISGMLASTTSSEVTCSS